MPLHSTSLTSRRDLEYPEEKPVVPLAFERVLKFNPNHDPKTGQFTESGGGRRGGTQGAPTEDAFGKPLQTRRSLGPESQSPRPARTGSGQFHNPHTAGDINAASNVIARPSVNAPPAFTAALHQYLYSHTQAAIPGETAKQYVDRQVTLGKIRKQRRVGYT